MNNYLIRYGEDYGIYQSDDCMRDVKILFNENATIEMWDKVEQITEYARKEGLNYVGFDCFYK